MKRLDELGIKIYKCDAGIQYLKWEEVDSAVENAGLDMKVFAKLFGIQTQHLHGPYPDDVEAVLERMITGRRTGTQLFWD